MPNFRLPKRKITIRNGTISTETRKDSTVSVEASGARFINDLPRDQRDTVIEALRDGVSHDALAKFFIENEWLSISEKTFKSYLGAFKRVHGELLHGPDEDTLSGLVSKRKPDLDEEVELQQLIRVNGMRLRKGVTFELTSGFVNKELHKDINAHRELVESLAKIRGKGTGAGVKPGQQQEQLNGEAQEQLRAIDQSEQGQSRMASLLGTLGNLMNQRASLSDDA